MTTPLSSFSGLISGFNYKDLVDEIIRVESRPVERLKAEGIAAGERQKALTTYRGLMDKLRSAAQSFRTGTALEVTAGITTVEAGTKALATVVTTAAASPSSFVLEVSQLARFQKLGGTAQPDAGAALGFSGTFTVNSATITVDADDTLTDIRDKINAVNTGATPSKVSASILTVGTNQHRLILSSETGGAAGMTLADTTGSILQTLGFLSGGVIAPAAVLVEGKDALFKLDGVAFVRTSNVVTDAVAGVTMTLTGEEVGARTGIRVERYADSAQASAKAFVEAYNGLVGFLKQQNSTASGTPALYGDNLIRTARSGLPTRLLQEVFGTAPDLATASAAGISFKRDGTLSLDVAKFDTAFRTRYQDLRSLFLEKRSATDPSVTLESGGGNAVGGTFAVDITAAASQGTLESLGFSGTYDAGATPDTLTVTDNQTGTSTQVVLTTGMSTGDIVSALQAAFDANGLSITASAAGNEVRLTHDNFGSLAGITVVNTGAGDGASELWAATATDYGSDVAGTIGGHPATGSGQVLVANPATAAAGLTVRHVGTVAGAAGTVTLTLGVGASIERFLDTYLETATGSIDRRSAILSERGRSLESRISQLETRLNERRASMLRRFNQMEVALGRLQKQTQALTGLLKPASSS